MRTSPCPVLPGISPATAEAAGLELITGDRAMPLCGCPDSGLWIPYRDMAGAPVMDLGGIYGRLRMDHPVASKKYHQRAGTGVHGYLTPSAMFARVGTALVITEGEKKALALSDAGIPAIGISGFFGFERRAEDGSMEWVPEIADALEIIKPSRINFLGDTDTALNASFSLAACRLAKRALCPVFLPRIPFNMPKGIDDVRELLNGGQP